MSRLATWKKLGKLRLFFRYQKKLDDFLFCQRTVKSFKGAVHLYNTNHENEQWNIFPFLEEKEECGNCFNIQIVPKFYVTWLWHASL